MTEFKKRVKDVIRAKANEGKIKYQLSYQRSKESIKEKISTFSQLRKFLLAIMSLLVTLNLLVLSIAMLTNGY